MWTTLACCYRRSRCPHAAHAHHVCSEWKIIELNQLLTKSRALDRLQLSRELIRRQRTAVIVALHGITAAFAQEFQLLAGLHALGNYGNVQASTDRYDGFAQSATLMIRRQTGMNLRSMFAGSIST